MLTVFFPKRVYWITTGVLLLLFCSTLIHRIAHFDDAWCTEQSYWLLKDGVVRSELFRGYNYWHERLYVFHKAFVYIQAAILHFVGFSIWGARATPLLFSAVTLLLLLVCFRNQREHQWLAAILYVGCGTLWLFGVDNRPETMVATCGFGSFLLLRRANLTTRDIVLAGLLAGLAGLTHLNGIIYVAAGSLWLWTRRGWLKAFAFGLVGGATLSLYLLDAVLDGRLDRLLYQFQHDHVTQNNLHWWSKLQVMAEYHRLFMHSEGETPLTILFLSILAVLLLVERLAWRAFFTPTLHYLLLLIGLFWLLTKSSTAYYFILFVPFIITVIVELTLSFFPQMSKKARLCLIVVFCLYPVGSVLRAYYLIRENQTYPNVAVENARLAAYMPRQGAKTIAPIDFFFGQMDNYRIRGLTYYSLLNSNQYQDQLTVPAFFAMAAQDSVMYIVSDHRTWNQAYHIPPNAPARIGAYQRVFQDQWHSIYTYRSPVLASSQE